MSEELKQKFMDFGALGYSKDRMASILGQTKQEFDKSWKDYEQSYQRGADEFEFAVDRKLMQLAINGDMKAMDKMDAKKRKFKRV